MVLAVLQAAALVSINLPLETPIVAAGGGRQLFDAPGS